MAIVNLGSIKFNWKGAYSGATAYVVDDVVESSGSSYICIAATTGNAPPNATYWEQMSSAGTNGTDGTDLGTTLTTQGDIVYRDGSGLARLGAGTSGQVLQTNGTGANPSWVDAGGGDFVLLADASTATSVGSISIDGYFSSTYNSYVLYFDSFVPASSTGDMQWRFNTGGSANSSGNYIHQTQQRGTSSGASGSGQSNSAHGADAFVVYGDRKMETSASSAGNGKIEIYNALSTTAYKYQKTYNNYFNVANSSEKMSLINDGCFTSVTALTGLTIYHSTGNLKGNFYLYGRKS